MKNSTEDIHKVIMDEFPKVRTQVDLLALLNKIKQLLVGGADENTCKPLTMSSLNYYKNVKVSRRIVIICSTLQRNQGN